MAGIFKTESLTVSAPGSVMITGEHAVLHGRHALVGAVDHRVQVSLTPRADDTIAIHSNLGERRMPRHAIDPSKPFNFIGAILERRHDAFRSGFDLTITAKDVPSDVGLGSSSAVTVATLAVIDLWLTGALPSHNSLMQDALTIIRSVQGMGSGADAAAAIWGGILLYRATPEVVAVHKQLPPATLVYAGYKTATPEVIRIVDARREQAADGFEALFDRIDANSLKASEALDAGNVAALGSILNEGQHLMEELGVCDDTLDDIVTTMRSMPDILGTKISGSGLGDCVLGIGTLTTVDWPYRVIPVHFTTEGVRDESTAPHK
jgi:mevalonate kinase